MEQKKQFWVVLLVLEYLLLNTNVRAFHFKVQNNNLNPALRS